MACELPPPTPEDSNALIEAHLEKYDEMNPAPPSVDRNAEEGAAAVELSVALKPYLVAATMSASPERVGEILPYCCYGGVKDATNAALEVSPELTSEEAGALLKCLALLIDSPNMRLPQLNHLNRELKKLIPPADTVVVLTYLYAYEELVKKKRISMNAVRWNRRFV